MVCIDSDIIIDFLNNKKGVVEKIIQLEENGELTTTSINVFEILKGFSKFNEEEKGYEFLKNLKILDFNYSSSEKAAEIFKELKSRGELIDQLDLFIAAISISNKQSLFTRNLSHFKRISGLVIEEM